MRIISRKALKEFWATHPDAEGPLEAWFREVLHATWKTPAELKAQYRSASVLNDKLVIFNIAGNKYRLAVRIFFDAQIVYIRFVGTHAEYDRMAPKGL
jgi:mRNA interferase HigB